MLPIERVVCPTDFSDPAREALVVAGELAAHFGAELVVVHVAPELPLAAAATPVMARTATVAGEMAIDSYQERVREDAAAELAALAREVVPAPVRVRERVLHGAPADSIVAAADDERADLIVIATHGRSRLERLFFGSVAEKVVRAATCPVLTIRPAQPEERTE